MNLENTDLIYKDCKIVPFENQAGKIISVCYSKKGVELQVRYYMNGEHKLDWFFDFDIELYE